MFRIASYHWTPTAQRRFVERLAETGSVQLACDAVSMSRVSAYRLRKRADARAFAIGWNAAVIMAQQEQVDRLMGYAIGAVDYVGVRHPVTRRLRWRVSDPALGRGRGLALLHRLDQTSDALSGADHIQARAVMRDFEAFLDLIEQGGDEGALAQFFGVSAESEKQPFMCNLRRNSGGDWKATGRVQ